MREERWQATFEGWKIPASESDTRLKIKNPKGPFVIRLEPGPKFSWIGRLMPTGQKFRGGSYLTLQSAKDTIKYEFERCIEDWKEVD